MSTLKQVSLLDKIDPYGIQRVVFNKSLCVAILAVFVYWICSPTDFIAYILPMFVAPFYEIPGIKSRQRDRNFLFIMSSVVVTGISFFLLYPFKFIFLFYAVSYLIIFHFIVERYFPALKTTLMVLLIIGALNLLRDPSPSFQQIYDLFFSFLLMVTVIYLGLKLCPGDYFLIWRRATHFFIGCLEKEINNLFLAISSHDFSEEVKHSNTMDSYMLWLPLHQKKHTIRINYHIKNIQFAISNTYYLDNKAQYFEFWRRVQKQLQCLNVAIDSRQFCQKMDIDARERTDLEKQVILDLGKVTHHWNKLCG